MPPLYFQARELRILGFIMDGGISVPHSGHVSCTTQIVGALRAVALPFSEPTQCVFIHSVQKADAEHHDRSLHRPEHKSQTGKPLDCVHRQRKSAPANSSEPKPTGAVSPFCSCMLQGTLAVLYDGNNHVIEFYEVRDVVQETSDAGVLYCGYDWTFRGKMVRYNFFHHILHQPGFGSRVVYLDDCVARIARRLRCM